jgi:hypothetical protein
MISKASLLCGAISFLSNDRKKIIGSGTSSSPLIDLRVDRFGSLLLLSI